MVSYTYSLTYAASDSFKQGGVAWWAKHGVDDPSEKHVLRHVKTSAE